MRLQDIKDGKVQISNTTSISFNGQTYRGKAAINDLIAKQLPQAEPKIEGQNDAGQNSDQPAGKSRKAAKPATETTSDK